VGSGSAKDGNKFLSESVTDSSCKDELLVKNRVVRVCADDCDLKVMGIKLVGDAKSECGSFRAILDSGANESIFSCEELLDDVRSSNFLVETAEKGRKFKTVQMGSAKVCFSGGA